MAGMGACDPRFVHMPIPRRLHPPHPEFLVLDELRACRHRLEGELRLLVDQFIRVPRYAVELALRVDTQPVDVHAHPVHRPLPRLPVDLRVEREYVLFPRLPERPDERVLVRVLLIFLPRLQHPDLLRDVLQHARLMHSDCAWARTRRSPDELGPPRQVGELQPNHLFGYECGHLVI